MLKNYVEQKPNFLVFLKYGDSILGESEIDLRKLLSGGLGQWSNNCGDREVRLDERCFLKTLDRRDEIINAEERPYLDVQLILTCIDMQSEVHGEPLPDYSSVATKNPGMVNY